MDSYKEMTDEELIRRLRNGEREIMDYVMEKYKYLVRKRANAMFLIGGETEDLIQEGMIGLFKAIRDFKEEKESSFYHFADMCVSRQIYNAIEASNRKKHRPLNSYVSLNVQDDESGMLILDMLISEESGDPEHLVINRENILTIRKKIQHILSGMEKEVMHHYLRGLNYRQIAEVMKRNPKVVDNALQRIKSKLGKLGEEVH